MIKSMIALGWCALLLAACESPKADDVEAECISFRLVPDSSAFPKTDSRDLMRADIAGDKLKLRIGYSGCVPDHRFDLYLTKSNDTKKVVALVHHDANGEACKVRFERDFCFDLRGLKDSLKVVGAVTLEFPEQKAIQVEYP